MQIQYNVSWYTSTGSQNPRLYLQTYDHFTMRFYVLHALTEDIKHLKLLAWVVFRYKAEKFVQDYIIPDDAQNP